MMSVYDMDAETFTKALAERTTPEALYENARVERFYYYLSEVFGESADDSVLREWAFAWWAETTQQPYEDIYERWLGRA